MEEIFSNVEGKLKSLAKLNFVCAIICAIILAIICLYCFYSGVGLLLGLGIGFIELLIGLISSWFIYGFAEILENVKGTRSTPKHSYSTDIPKKTTQEIYAERVREKSQTEEISKIEKLTEQVDISAFWYDHPNEMKALLERLAGAKEKLSKAAGLTDTQKKELQDLIHDLEIELSTDY